jgi:monofunctional biosynthetic peptidoglycan transglycosylase
VRRRLAGFWRLVRRLLVVLLVLLVLWQLSLLARIWWWRDHDPGATAFMAVRAEQRAEDHRPPLAAHPWVPYAHISPNLKRAVVAAEDSRFLSHDGFDWEGMEDALRKDMQRHRLVAGGSTITQQLAKNLFLSERRTLPRKLEEAVITLMLEKLWGKRRILEVYLNVIEWGDGVFGCEAAARHYFHAGAGQLDAGQAARLAAMIPSPRFYDRHPGSRTLAHKTDTLLARMPAVPIP